VHRRSLDCFGWPGEDSCGDSNWTNTTADKEVVEELTKLHSYICVDKEEAVIADSARATGCRFNFHKRTFNNLCGQVASDYNSYIKWDIGLWGVHTSKIQRKTNYNNAGSPDCSWIILGRTICRGTGMRGNEQFLVICNLFNTCTEPEVSGPRLDRRNRGDEMYDFFGFFVVFGGNDCRHIGWISKPHKNQACFLFICWPFFQEREEIEK